MARRSRLCLAVLAAFLVAYVFVGALAVIGSRGMFGVEPDPLSVVWLVIIGLPWTLLLGILPGDSIPEFLARLFIALVPLLNLWLLSRLCRRHRRRY